MKKTPLYAAHRRAGAKMVEFAGWDMPVQYQGVIQEHLAVRGQAGLFDVSHMGEIEIRGEGALDLCQRISANDVARMKPFQAQYNLLLNENGGIVDDVIFYRLSAAIFFICVNAANTDKDFHWIERQAHRARQWRLKTSAPSTPSWLCKGRALRRFSSRSRLSIYADSNLSISPSPMWRVRAVW